LHLDVVQAVAVTELLLEGWVEPPVPPCWYLSTLTQHIISVIALTGGVPAQRLFERLCVRGPFREVGHKSFADLLRQLARQDVVEQMDAGDLILGLKGEKIRRDRSFYAVFPTPEQYTVLHAGQVLGSLECAHEKDDHLLFAGRRWRVTDADHERLELHVVPAHGWRRPKFMGGGGEVHPEVRQRMRKILSASGGYRYLDAEGHELLDDARKAAADAGALSNAIIPLGPQRVALMTWTGSRVQETLRVVFQSVGFETHDERVGLEFRTSTTAVRNAIVAALAQLEGGGAGLKLDGAFGPGRKYDGLLGDTLRLDSYRLGWLQLDEARQTLRGLAPV
jgi:ATP-dependent Lhr-like helicase